MRHLRKDSSEVIGEPLLSEDEQWVTIPPKGELDKEVMCVISDPLASEWGRGLPVRGGSSQCPSVCPPCLSKVCVKLPDVLFGWRQA